MHDTYVRDEETGIYARPVVHGHVPETPHRSLLVWRAFFSGQSQLCVTLHHPQVPGGPLGGGVSRRCADAQAACAKGGLPLCQEDMQSHAWTKPHILQVERVYLIQQQDGLPCLEDVFVLDHATRELRREEVLRQTDETDPTEVTLRIR